MNIYKNNILITLLSLLILDSNKTARSQEVIENADVILPRPEEYIGFKIRLIRGNLKFPKEENAGNIHNFEIKNESTGCNIGINFIILKQKSKHEDIFEILSWPPGKLKNGSYSKGIIAEKSWYSIRNNSETGNIDEYALSISEGKVGMTTYISMDSIKDNRGNTITLPINPADIRLLEILVIRMLDRMTVFGLTSKPKESAPEWAKRQVAERLAGRKQ